MNKTMLPRSGIVYTCSGSLPVAVVGAGKMGRGVIRHLKECPGVARIVAYDVSAEQRRFIREAEGIAVADSLDDVLNDRSLRLVFVTASNDAHAELTWRALNAGKAVMCEKPMANTLADAERMVREAENRKAFLQIGFEARYSLLYIKIKEWIDAGLLGDVRNTHCFYITSAYPKSAWRIHASRSGSMFAEKLSHYVDLPRWWIGADVTEITAYSVENAVRYMEIRDNYHATYRFANGAVSHLTFLMGPAATFHGDPLQANMLDLQQGDGHAVRYLVTGTRGAAETDVFARHIKRWAYGENADTFTCEWTEYLTWHPEEDHIYFHNTLHQTHDIVRRVLQGLPPRTAARDALQTMRLCFAAEESARQSATIRLGEGADASPQRRGDSEHAVSS